MALGNRGNKTPHRHCMFIMPRKGAEKMVLRNIVKIDEEKCTGCGICIPTCAEGALQIVNGKAYLISDKYCDGLGACLGECPEGAITITTRDAEEFDEDAVHQHLTRERLPQTPHLIPPPHPPRPSAQVRQLDTNTRREAVKTQWTRESMLTSWPVQLSLLPTNATFFKNADLLIAADCVPFAYADFHNDFLRDRVLVVGCPKLDNVTLYKEKLTKLFSENPIKSITVVNMEVPCCLGLHRLVKEALSSSEKAIPLRQETISLKGDKR